MGAHAVQGENLRTRLARFAAPFGIGGSLTLVAMGAMPSGISGQEREWLPLPLQTAAFEDLDGDLFGSPQRIRGTPEGGFLVDDWGDFTLRAFSATGELLWVAGGEGQGPGEFSGFWDVEYDADGTLLVLDERNRRLTVLDSFGNLQSTLRLPDGMMEQVMPSSWAPDDRVLMPRDKATGVWVGVSEGGFVSRRGPVLPIPSGHSMPTQAFAAPLRDGGEAVAFRWSDWIVMLDSAGRIRTTINGVEAIPFPEVVSYTPNTTLPAGARVLRVTRIDREATRAVRSITADSSRLLVLFEGASERASRIVDTYGIRDGAYLGSYLLPGPVSAIAALTDGRLATLETTFVPTVRLWSLPAR